MKKLLLLPVCMVCIALTVQAQDEPPPPPPPPPPKIVKTKYVIPPVIVMEGKKADEFYKKNPSVASIKRQGDIITLGMKDNTTEKYDLAKQDEKKSFTDKYGKAPMPDPPMPAKRIDVKIKKTPPPPPSKPADQ